MQRIGDLAQHAKGMALISGGLQAADLLLRSVKKVCQLFLRKSGRSAQGCDLKRNVPSLASVRKACVKSRIKKLRFKVLVKIGFLHRAILLCQSSMRSRAVSRSRAGMVCPLLRMPCTATMRRCFIKNQSTRTLSLPTWPISNKPIPLPSPPPPGEGTFGHCIFPS